MQSSEALLPTQAVPSGNRDKRHMCFLAVSRLGHLWASSCECCGSWEATRERPPSVRACLVCLHQWEGA